MGSIVLYTELAQHLKQLPLNDVGRVLLGILEYAETGDEPQLSGAAAMCFSFVRAQVDRDKEKWEQTRIKRAEAGRAGGLASGKVRSNAQGQANEANASFAKQNEANEAVSVPVPVITPPLPPKGKATMRRTRSAKDEPGEGFTAFWEAYPRKQGKQDAVKAWNRLKPDTELAAAIITAVQQASCFPNWQRDNGRFIPYPSTYLNGRRWEDEITGSDKAQTAAHVPPRIPFTM